MTANGTMEPTPTEPLRIDLTLEGEDGERWRVRVGLRPTQGPTHIDGATVALCDGAGRQLGPAVVLPVAGEIADYVELHGRIQGPRPLRPGSVLRCTTFFSSGNDPQVAEEPVVPRRGFSAWMRGECVVELPSVVEGRALTEDEVAALRLAWPDLLPEAASQGTAFDVFRDDLLASLDLEEDDSVTEEILRMLKGD